MAGPPTWSSALSASPESPQNDGPSPDDRAEALASEGEARSGGKSPVSPPTAARSLVWAISATPVWAVLALLPAALLRDRSGLVVGWALIGGMYAAALLVTLMDRRIGHPVPPLPVALRAPASWMWGSAWLAGCGATVLSSELGNVALSLFGGDVIPAEAAGAGVVAVIPTWQLGVVWGLLHPWGFVLVLCVMTHRRLMAFGHRGRALWITIGLGAMTLPGPLFQVVALVAFPVWVFSWTRSMGVALVSYLPSALTYVLGLAGVVPGIDGFDVVRADEVLFQPVWFDLLGAALLAAGVFPFLRKYGSDAPRSPTRA